MRKLLLLLLSGVAVSTMSIGQSYVTNYPYFEGFENESTCTMSCGSTCNFSGDFSNDPNAQRDWKIDVNGTTSSSTGPSVDHTLGTSTGKYVTMETSSCYSQTHALISPYFNLTSTTNPQVSFWYHMYGTTMGTMHIDVDTTNTGAWINNIIPAWTDNQDLWQQKVINIGFLAGQDSVRFRIRGISGSSFRSDMAFDDFMIENIVDNDYGIASVANVPNGCGLTANESFDVDIKNFGALTLNVGETIYVHTEVNTTTYIDTVVLTMALPNGASMSHNVTGIDVSTAGVYNVKTYTVHPLDVINNSNDTTYFDITHILTINQPEYYENFEGNVVWESGGNNSSWAMGTPNKNTIIGAASGTNAWTTGGLSTGSYNSNENSYVLSNCYDMTNYPVDGHMALDIWWNSEFSWDGAVLQVKVSNTGNWMNVGNFNDPYNWYTDNTINGTPGGSSDGWTGRTSTNNGSGGWVTATHELGSITSGSSQVRFRIAFGSDGSAQDDGFAFDNFRYGPNPNNLFGNDTAVCSGYELGAIFSTGNFLWSNGDTTATTTLFNPTQQADTQQIVLTYTHPYGFEGQDTIQVIVQPGPQTNVSSITHVSCNGADDGAIHTNANGSTGPYSFNWSNGSSDSTLTNLAPGTYCLTVSGTTNSCVDSSNCILIMEPDSLLGDLTPFVHPNGFNTSCPESYDGIIANVVTGGTPPYNYLWTGDNGYGSSSQNIDQIQPDGYHLTITDANGCTYTKDITLNSPPALDPATSITDVDCAENGNGAIATSTTGGSGGYTYLWGDGSITSSLSNLSGGTYMLTIEDNSGCSASFALTVGEPDPLISGAATVNNAGCASDNDGNASVSITGGTSPYTYVWNDPANQTTLLANNLKTGDYSCTITDANGCSVIQSVVVGFNFPLPEVNLANQSDTSMFIGQTLNLVAGSAVHSYTWNDGSVGNTKTFTVSADTLIHVTGESADGCFNSDTLQVLAVVSTNDLDEQVEFIAYPNPTQDQLTVQLNGVRDNINIRLIDLTSKVLIEENLGSANFISRTLDLSSYANGVYLLDIKGNGHHISKRIIKK